MATKKFKLFGHIELDLTKENSTYKLSGTKEISTEKLLNPLKDQLEMPLELSTHLPEVSIILEQLVYDQSVEPAIVNFSLSYQAQSLFEGFENIIQAGESSIHVETSRPILEDAS